MTRRGIGVVALCALTLFFVSGAAGQERILGAEYGKLHEIDPVTGQATQIATLSGGGTIGALAYDPVGDILFAASSSLDQLFTIDYKSGVVTLVGDFNRPGIDPVMHGLEYCTATGQLFGLDYRDHALVEIDKKTGQATTVGITPLTGFGSLAWDASNGVLFGGDSGTDSLWQIEPKSGAGTLVGPFNATGAGSLGTGMAWSATYGLLGINNSSTDSLWSIDPNTGAAKLIGETGTGNMLGLAVIPEPTTALLLIGVLGLARRR